MKLLDYISDKVFRPKTNVIYNSANYTFADLQLSRLPFGKVVFVSISELLTNLCNDVTFVRKSGDVTDFATFNAFFTYNSQFVLTRIFLDGFVVIGKSHEGLKVLNTNEYRKVSNGTITKAVAVDSERYPECYVMKSNIYENFGQSDYTFCQPFVKYLDNALNASNTTLERLGAVVIASPKSQSGMPTIVTLNKSQKDELEKEIQKEYGALNSQKNIMVLPREMAFDTINLASLDLKTNDRIRTAILAICDRLKVPANQVAIIDANSSKSLSNGSELREGDYNKYQSFERLLNATFLRMAQDMRLQVDYTIYNKPVRTNESN